MSNYRVPVLEKFSWQPPVQSILATEPATPTKGQRWIVGVGATGTNWSGQDNKIATCSNATGPTWLLDIPQAGWEAYNEATGKFIYFDGANWVEEATQGVSGYSGYSGISGYSGYSGESGYSGYSGTSGYSGYSGYSGTSGYSGYSGESGYSGYSGPSGYSGYSGLSGWSGTPGTLQGVTYYTDDDPSDIPGMMNALRTPDADPETVVATVATASGALAEDYVTAVADPGETIIESGLWGANIWAKIDSAGGTNTIRVEVHARATGGSETLLFSMVTPDITSVDPAYTRYEIISAQPEFNILASDRLVFKFYAVSSAGKTITYTVGGNTRYSHVHTPLINRGYSGMSGYSGAQGTSGYSGYSGVSGFSGYSGESGYSGYSGISGYSGYSGSGVSGYSGYSGDTGTSGYSGYSGESGYSGYSGATGSIGTSGYSGFSGESGYSGYSGAAGTSGYSGFSGPGATYDVDYECLIIGG